MRYCKDCGAPLYAQTFCYCQGTECKTCKECGWATFAIDIHDVIVCVKCGHPHNLDELMP